MDGMPGSSGHRTVAPVPSTAPKQKAFDRGGPDWPPRSNAEDDRSWGVSGGALPPPPKTGGFGGHRPPAKIETKSKLKKNLAPVGKPA